MTFALSVKICSQPYTTMVASVPSSSVFTADIPDEAESVPAIDAMRPDSSILVVTGVANPKPFARFLRRHKAKVKLKRFTDHHNFTASDMDEISRLFDQLPGTHKFIATTEKDAVRLLNNPYFPHRLKKSIFYVPIKVDFIDRDDTEFTLAIEKTIRDSRLFKN